MRHPLTKIENHTWHFSLLDISCLLFDSCLPQMTLSSSKASFASSKRMAFHTRIPKAVFEFGNRNFKWLELLDKMTELQHH